MEEFGESSLCSSHKINECLYPLTNLPSSIISLVPLSLPFFITSLCYLSSSIPSFLPSSLLPAFLHFLFLYFHVNPLISPHPLIPPFPPQKRLLHTSSVLPSFLLPILPSTNALLHNVLLLSPPLIVSRLTLLLPVLVLSLPPSLSQPTPPRLSFPSLPLSLLWPQVLRCFCCLRRQWHRSTFFLGGFQQMFCGGLHNQSRPEIGRSLG